MQSDTHNKAIALPDKPNNLEALFKTTPTGRAFSGASTGERTCVSKLIDIVYLIATEESVNQIIFFINFD